MNLSPLKLSGCFFTKVSISTDPNTKSDDSNNFDVSVSTQPHKNNPDQPRLWFILLKVSITPKEGALPPYFGEIEVFGSFSVDESWPEDKIEQLVWINGSGLLYAAVREMVCSITSRGFYPMILLPSWSFGQTYNEHKQKSQQPESDPDSKQDVSTPPAEGTRSS